MLNETYWFYYMLYFQVAFNKINNNITIYQKNKDRVFKREFYSQKETLQEMPVMPHLPQAVGSTESTYAHKLETKHSDI